MDEHNQPEPHMHDWPLDIREMHINMGMKKWANENRNNLELLKKMLDFRMKFLIEELEETRLAIAEGDPEEIVDGCIDLCVVAIGTLDVFEVDVSQAWDEVHLANMKKKLGIKPNRPNPLGLPDLMKPEGWKGPSHKGNHGMLDGLFTNDLS